MSKLSKFIRIVHSECGSLPLHATAKCIRMNREMFDRLDDHALNNGIDITMSTSGRHPPRGYNGMIADLPILVDDDVDSGTIQLDYDFARMGI